MSTPACDKCGGPLDAPGAITVRILTGSLPERWPRADLCYSCGDALTRWLDSGTPAAGPAEVLGDEQVSDSDDGGP